MLIPVALVALGAGLGLLAGGWGLIAYAVLLIAIDFYWEVLR